MFVSRVFNSNLLILFAFILALIGSGIVAGIEATSLVILLFAQLFGILLPGMTIASLIHIPLKDSVSYIFAGYAIGYALTSILYALMIVFNIHHLSPYIFYFICITSIVTLYFKRDVLPQLVEKSENNTFLFVVFILMVAIGFLVYQIPFRSAMITGFQDMYFDSTYWFKNCVASTKGYPLPELSVLGNNLYWHLFSCFNIAMLHLSTNIEIYDLCFSLSSVTRSFLLVGCSYVFLNEFTKTKWYLRIAIIILLFCTSIEPLTWVYFLEHIYATHLGVVDGLSLSLISVVFFSKSYKEGRFILPLLIIAVFLYVAAVGSKVPNGLMVLVFVGSIMLYDVIKTHKINYSFFLVASLYALLFVLISKVFVIDGNALVSETSSHKLTLNFSTTIRPSIINLIYEKMVELGLGNVIPIIILSIPYVIVTSPIMALFALAIILLIKNRRIIRDEGLSAVLFSLLLVSFSGILLFLAFDHPGFSQVYFLFGIFPFALLFSINMFERYIGNASIKYSRVIYVIISLIIICNIAISKRTFILKDKYDLTDGMVSKSGTSISRNEMIGLRWARDNMPEGAVIITNKVLEKENGKKSFITSAYSERQVYLEGYVSTNLPNDHIVNDRIGVINSFFSGNLTARDSLVAKGVNYVVVYKNISDVNVDKDKVLYENEEIIICDI